jgi:hypothetical protein
LHSDVFNGDANKLKRIAQLTRTRCSTLCAADKANFRNRRGRQVGVNDVLVANGSYAHPTPSNIEKVRAFHWGNLLA